MYKSKIHPIEAAALLALCITLCVSASAQARQTVLEDNVIRLHVVAVSDDENEQRIKREVRDAVLSLLEPRLSGCETAAQAREAVLCAVPDIERAALESSEGREVHVSLGRERFHARTGDGYTLPAGEYTTLRVTLGGGGGHNWWGVVFPDLVPGPDADFTDAASILGEDNIALITDAEGRELRFRLLDWLFQFRDSARW